MKTVGDLVRGRDVYYVRDGQTVREVARYMTERRVGAVAVMSGDRLAGILSERDIMGRVVAAQKDPDSTLAGDVMTRELVVAKAADTWEDGLRLMKQASCRHLPVVEADHFLGVISQRDLMKIDITQKDDEIRWLNAYIHFIPPTREGTS
jgi:CBS domain-containing protein